MSKINVLLLEDVTGLGKAGDIAVVSEGYARNSLFPSGKAAQATPVIQKSYADKKAREKESQAKLIAQLQEKAELLDGTELTFSAKVKEGENIFGSISKKDIVEELKTKAKLSVKPAQIDVEAPIKQLGSYDMTIHLSPEVECLMKLTVLADPSSLTTEDDE